MSDKASKIPCFFFKLVTSLYPKTIFWDVLCYFILSKYQDQKEMSTQIICVCVCVHVCYSYKIKTTYNFIL